MLFRRRLQRLCAKCTHCSLYIAPTTSATVLSTEEIERKKKREQSPTNTVQRTFEIENIIAFLIQIMPNESYQFVLVRLFEFSAIYRNLSNECVHCTDISQYTLCKIENQFHHFFMSLHQQLIDHMLMRVKGFVCGVTTSTFYRMT